MRPIAVATVLATLWLAALTTRLVEEAHADTTLAPGTHDLRVMGASRERSYYLHLPPAAAEGSALPLLIAFHGGGGNAGNYRKDAGLDAVADREGFVVAYPDGSGRLGRRLLTWNAGGCCGLAMREDVDDVAFARALVKDVARRTPIDRTRVYATGHSNGAMMSYRVAVEAPELVAAIAPVGAAMKLDRFETDEPMPVLHIHSVDDPRALYEGGLGPPFPMTRSRVDHNAVETELRRWIVLNGCPTDPEVIEQRTEVETGFTARRMRFAPCTTGADVEMWQLTGAGHGWPGADVRRRERLIGPGTKVILASEEVWRFVSRFERPRLDEERQLEKGSRQD